MNFCNLFLFTIVIFCFTALSTPLCAQSSMVNIHSVYDPENKVIGYYDIPSSGLLKNISELSFKFSDELDHFTYRVNYYSYNDKDNFDWYGQDSGGSFLNIVCINSRVNGYMFIPKIGEIVFSNNSDLGKLVFEVASSTPNNCNRSSLTDCLAISETCGPIAVDDCKYVLFVENSSELLTELLVEWYTSDDGIFDPTDASGSQFIGEGDSIEISNSDLFDPCKQYFFHAVFSINGDVKYYKNIVLDGNPCVDNVWCENYDSDKSLSDIEQCSWIYHYAGGFREGVIRIMYESDTLLDNNAFKKFNRNFTVLEGISGDTVQGDDLPIYLRQVDDIVYASFDGVSSDTLYNYGALPGDTWTFSILGNDLINRLEYLVQDIFFYNTGDLILKAQVVKFNFLGLDSITYSDTIIENIGFLNNYIDPFEFFNSNGTESEIGSNIRCYSDATQVVEFHSDKIYAYSYDCGDILSRVVENTTIEYLTVIGNPFYSEIIIDNSSNKSETIDFFSISGTLINKFAVPNGRSTYNTASWPVGIYFGVSSSGQIIKVVKH